MSWTLMRPAVDGTHHTLVGTPAYAARFDEVLEYRAPGLAPVRNAGLAWHIRPNGSAAYAYRFVRTFGFYEGRAAVSELTGWHHITIDGNAAYASRYAWCGNFQSGLSSVRDARGDYYHIDADGGRVYAASWRYAGDFRDSCAVVQSHNGYSTHIDARGSQLHSRWFLDLDVFHKGYARARDEHGWLHVDRLGRAVYLRRFAAVEPFYNGQARVERHDGALEVIDESGVTVLVLRPAFASTPIVAL